MPATDADSIVLEDELTTAIDAADIAEWTPIKMSMAEKLMYLVEKRAENRTSGDYDLIVVFDDWAFADWSDADIANEKFWLVGHVEDYSDSAYKVQGAFEVASANMEEKSLEEVRSMYVTTLLDEVDGTDQDFIEETGEAFVPKSAVETIIVVEPIEE